MQASRFAFSACVLSFSAAAPPARTAEPRLGIVVVADQFRGDYLERFEPHFGAGGFRRLREGGANFTDCHYRHAVTKTAPGHATIATGVHADVHGIVANEWLNLADWQVVESVEDSAYPLVGAAPRPAGPGGYFARKAGRSPRRLLATTVADQLKLRFRRQSRVISISNKDRSAILLGGLQADAAYWVNGSRFVTSTYYQAELPEWVEAFNREGRVEASFGDRWGPLRDPALYEQVQGPDDMPGEADRPGRPRTLPKPLTGEAGPDDAFVEAYFNSPLSFEWVTDFAARAIREEQLGQRATPDLLCVSYSSLDVVGHAYGPDSHEVMDAVLRLDRALERLLEVLDAEVGLERCVIVFTADHGASPLPERVQGQRGVSAGRFDGAALDRAIAAQLNEVFGPLEEGAYWATRDNFGYHLEPHALASRQLDRAAVARAIKELLQDWPGIAAAFTREELQDGPAEADTVLAMSRRSYHRLRGHDVVYVLAPYFMDRQPDGTNHGSPYHYDTHVPLLWFGVGVPQQTSIEQVGVESIAPTLAALLGIPPPPQAKGRRLF